MLFIAQYRVFTLTRIFFLVYDRVYTKHIQKYISVTISNEYIFMVSGIVRSAQ